MTVQHRDLFRVLQQVELSSSLPSQMVTLVNSFSGRAHVRVDSADRGFVEQRLARCLNTLAPLVVPLIRELFTGFQMTFQFLLE